MFAAHQAAGQRRSACGRRATGAGGRARRMGGGDKPLLTLAGRPVLAHIVDALRPQVSALAINAGVAGSFGEYDEGEVVNVPDDCFSELGAEDDEEFLSIDFLENKHLGIDTWNTDKKLSDHVGHLLTLTQ